MNKRSMGPGTLLAPLPVVLVGTTGETEHDGVSKVIQNAMTAAWTGIVNSEPAMLSVSIQPPRLTHRFVMETGEFSINVPTGKIAPQVDLCGVRSGRDLDKTAACHFTPVRLEGLSVTAGIAECPLILACRVHEVRRLGSHDLFIAKIVNVLADDDLFDGDTLNLENRDLLSYMHGNYYSQGERIGFFGYSVAKQNVLKRRLPKAHWPKNQTLAL
ncbi:MAG TPA: flavin reductase family protein [Clostridiaceae bacterium]|nr:flavin reductase family protein [Clostridiaceae bacterium]